VAVELAVADPMPPPRTHLLRQELWHLPNILTLARVAVLPLFVLYTYYADPLHSFLAAMIFTGAAVTDLLDGYLARRMHLETVLGKFLDPLADKLIVMAALVMMVRLGRLAAWVVILLLARELVVGGLRTIAATEGMVIAAGQEGKWKTSLQLVGVIALCLHYEHPVDFFWATYPVSFNAVGQVLVYLSTFLSVWSLVVYFRGFLQTIAARERPQTSAS